MIDREIEVGEYLIRMVFRDKMDKNGNPTPAAFMPRVALNKDDIDDDGKVSHIQKSKVIAIEDLKDSDKKHHYEVCYTENLINEGIKAYDDSDDRRPLHAFVDFRDLTEQVAKIERARILCVHAQRLHK